MDAEEETCASLVTLLELLTLLVAKDFLDFSATSTDNSSVVVEVCVRVCACSLVWCLRVFMRVIVFLVVVCHIGGSQGGWAKAVTFSSGSLVNILS